MNELDLLDIELCEILQTCTRPDPDGSVAFSANYLHRQLAMVVVKLRVAHRALVCINNSNPYPDLSDHKYRDAAKFVAEQSGKALGKLEGRPEFYETGTTDEE